MHLSKHLIPYYYDFNQTTVAPKAEIAMPQLSPSVRLLIFATIDLTNDTSTQFTFKMQQMCQKLNLKPDECAIANFTYYPNCLPHLSTTYPQLKALLLHGIDLQAAINRPQKIEIEKLLLGTIKTLSAPSLTQLEANKPQFIEYWNDVKRLIL
jgi:hypothetical protein